MKTNHSTTSSATRFRAELCFFIAQGLKMSNEATTTVNRLRVGYVALLLGKLAHAVQDNPAARVYLSGDIEPFSKFLDGIQISPDVESSAETKT